jgi:hypothetical protein
MNEFWIVMLNNLFRRLAVHELMKHDFPWIIPVKM